MMSVSGTGADIVLDSAPSSYDFGTIVLGSGATPKTFTITNTGTHASGTIGTALTGPNASEFSLTANTCIGSTLSPGVSCTLQVRFVPLVLGARSAALTVTANGGITTVPLDGTLVMPSAGILEANPTTLTFADQTAGTTSASQSFTVTNTDTVTTGTINLAVTGAGAAAFGTTTTCTTLAPQASCDVMVTFSPDAIGLYQASVEATAMGANTVAVAVDGNGI